MTAPIQDLSNAATFVKFVLTAHLAYENTEVITKDFNIRCDLIKLKAIKDISSMTSGQVVSFYGYYLGASALLPSAGGVFFGDGTAAIMIYGYSGTLPTVGATCHITGKYAPYSGLSEISGASIETVAATDANWVAMAPQTPVDLTYTGAEALANRDQGRITHISGTVAAAPVVDNYSNVKFTVTLASGSLYVLADSRYTAASVITTLKTLAAGSHVSLTGWLGYSSSYQLTAPFAVAL